MSGPTYVLVPGAGGMPWFWHRVVSELRRQGSTGVAVDLPGDDESAGLAAYADLVVAAGDGADDVVLVAQSLGGFSAPLACDRLPVSRLVLLNAMIPVPGETPGQWWDATGHGEAIRANDVRQGRDPDAGFDLETYFMHDVPDEVKVGGANLARDEAAVVFGDTFDLPAWPEVPTTVLSGAGDRFFPLDFQRRVAKERLGLDVVEIPGGHCAALAYPAELVDRLVAP